MLPTLRARTGAVLTALILGLAGLAVGTASPAGAEVRNCGDVEPYVYNLRADGVSCRAAKKLTRKWFDKAVSDGSVDDDVRVSGFRCKYSWEGKLPMTRCKDGGKRVKWNAALM